MNNLVPFQSASVQPTDISISAQLPFGASVSVGPLSLSVGYGPLIGDVIAPFALIMTGTRFIGTIIPDVTVEESHRDETRITEHPVETGAAITDHAFMEPFEVQMRVGFSNSTAGAEGYVQMVYQMFQQLQQKREPFSVSTGKRLYSNMLVKSLSVITDPSSEYALNAIVALRQIIITNVTFTQSNGQQNTGSQTPQGTAPPVVPVQSSPLPPPSAGARLTLPLPSSPPPPVTPWEWVAAQPVNFELPPNEYVQGIPMDYLATTEVWV